MEKKIKAEIRITFDEYNLINQYLEEKNTRTLRVGYRCKTLAELSDFELKVAARQIIDEMMYRDSKSNRR